MKINSLKYVRKFNLGNYESEEVGVDAMVEDGENATSVLDSMIQFVNTKGKVNNVQPYSTGALGKTTAPSEPTVVEEPKKKAAAPKKEKAPEPVKEEAAPAPAPAPEEPKQTKKKASSVTKYDRSAETHRKLFSEILEANVKDWKMNSEKAKEVSVELIGQDFLDMEGKVLPEFKTKCIEKMAAR